MHEKIFFRPAVEAKHRGGLLGAHFDCFITWMQERGYSRHSIQSNVQQLGFFQKYLKRKSIHSIHQLEGEGGQELLVSYGQYWKRRKHWHKSSAVQLYTRALEEAGVLKCSPSNSSPLLGETQEYISFLRDHRGLCEKTISNHVYGVEKFLRFLGCQEHSSSLPVFGIADVDEFFQQETAGLQRSTQQCLAGVLRGFVQFLYQSGQLATDLAPLITSPRLYKLESLPTVLNWDEIQKILGSVDRSTKSELRNYAILILLTTYGLRAGEVAKIKLKDIDWRKETIYIAPGKTGKVLLLPLIPQVGKAILGYLKHARPPSKYREVFLLKRAPWTPVNGHIIARIVNRYIRLAGLSPSRHGPHLFRHSFATHLKRRGAPFKEIGDLLGHQDPNSTHLYTKNAVEDLREVALEIPEVK